MTSLLKGTGVILAALVLSFAITAIGQGLWGVMVMANIKLSPAIPWAAAIMPFVLAALAAFLAGRSWPTTGAAARRALVPLAPVSKAAWIWSLTAGGAGVIACAGLWTVLTSLVRTPPNLLPAMGSVPLLSGAAFLAVSIVAAPLTEEIAFRGYAMQLLRGRLGAPAAIVISSLMFAAAHLTQGLYATKLAVYLLFGLMLAVMVWRLGSLLPAMVVHSFGDLTFFTTVWPHDAARRLVSEGGGGAGFFVALAITVASSAAWAIAFRRLVTVTSRAAGDVGERPVLAPA